MIEHEWHFRLDGEELDVRDLVNLFGSIKSIKDGEGRSYLVLKLPYPSTEYHAGVQAGTDFVAKLNAIAQVRCGDHENVKIGATGYVNPESGLFHQHIAVQGFRIRTRFYPVTISTGDPGERPPTPFGDQPLMAAGRDEHFDRALYLLGALSPDWRGLYLVLEAAEDTNGGESGLISRRWVPDGQIKAFKATANHIRRYSCKPDTAV